MSKVNALDVKIGHILQVMCFVWETKKSENPCMHFWAWCENAGFKPRSFGADQTTTKQKSIMHIKENKTKQNKTKRSGLIKTTKT